MPLNIVLVEPEIPQNTGNISRTCAATGSVLHLVRPLGFTIDDRKLKRAGLDYWQYLDIRYHDSLDDFFKAHQIGDFFFSTTKAKYKYSEVTYSQDSIIFFGKETAGLPEELLSKNYDRSIRIPMKEEARSLNLSNSVAIVVYEALRQLDFPDLKIEGRLTKNEPV